MFSTADLCDAHGDLAVADSIFNDYGQRRVFAGEIVTIRVPADFLLVKQTLGAAGGGKVLVVDGGGATGYALLGDRLAGLARDNGWSGVIVNGCVRDSAELGRIDIGIRALSTCPRRPAMEGAGQSGVEVRFAGVTFVPGHYVYADADGLVIAATPLPGA